MVVSQPAASPPAASPPARSAARRAGLPVLAAVLLVATSCAWALVHQPSPARSGSTAAPVAVGPPTHRSHGTPGGLRHSPVGEADGVVPAGVTVYDDRLPAVTRLDPDLRAALRRAATAAGGDGVEMHVNSGWRSPAYQEQLLREAVAKYGSEREAARWVATPERSAHVSGDAVDLGPARATDWLSQHGARYGLCQVYDDEPWHFELRPAAVERGCPQRYPDPAHDPRTER